LFCLTRHENSEFIRKLKYFQFNFQLLGDFRKVKLPISSRLGVSITKNLSSKGSGLSRYAVTFLFVTDGKPYTRANALKEL
jgi:hypothetical protein